MVKPRGFHRDFFFNTQIDNNISFHVLVQGFKLTYLVPSTAINRRFGGFGDFVSGPHVIDVGGNVFDHHPWLLFQLLL